mgnify:FL=1
MKQFLERENLIPRIVTLIVACGLWLYVMSEQNPMIERDFVVKLQQRNVAENMVVLNAPENVKVKVSGQRSVLGGVTEKEVVAYIDCAGLDVGQQNVPVVVQFPEGQVIEVNPNNIYLYIDEISEKTMPVETIVIGLPANDYALSKQEVAPETVTVRGAGHRLDALVKVVAPVDVSEKERDFEVQSHLVAISDTGAEMHDLAIEPAEAKIKATLVRQMITTELPVIVSTTGELADGKKLVKAESTPAKVSILAEPSVAHSLVALHTKQVDLSRLRSDGTVDVELDLPPHVMCGTKTVTVKFVTED